MSLFGNRLSITSRSLRPQLLIAFCLMSVIPLLACLNLVFPSIFPRSSVGVIIIVVSFLSLLGFFVVKRIVDPIIEISSEMKVVANGEVSRRLNISRNDEIGDLSNALNQMTQRIKDDMDELKIYGERTKDINLQINKQVIVLNGLLQISSLVTKGAVLKEIFEISISRLAQVANSTLAFILLEENEGYRVVGHYGFEAEVLATVEMPSNYHFINNLLFGTLPLKVDAANREASSSELLKFFGARNLLAYPVLMHGRVAGILGIGNGYEKFNYTKDDEDLMNIFTKQISIALENDFLNRKVQDLETKDALTGLYNKRYMVARLDEEILRAISHQQPCSLILLQLGNLKELYLKGGSAMAEEALRKVASVLKSGTSEIDRVGRLEERIFGVVLPEKNKRKAQVLGAKLIEQTESIFRKEDPSKRPSFQLSVVENPIDGVDAQFLFEKAKIMLNA